MAKKFENYQPKVSWPLFINGYLHAARLNLEEIKRFIEMTGMRSPTTSGIITDPGERAWFDYFLGLFHLWMPTIFCVRHACELVLKSISIRLYDEFYASHNLEFLRQHIGQDDIFDNFFEGDFEKFEALCIKYYSYTFNNKGVVNPPGLIDKLNTVFRYPENEDKTQLYAIDLNYFLDDITIAKIDEFLNDIVAIHDLSGRFQATMGHAAEFAAKGLSPEEAARVKKRWKEILDAQSARKGLK